MPQQYTLGPRVVDWNDQLKQLAPSNDVLNTITKLDPDDPATPAAARQILHDRFERDGYFYFKQLIPRDAVLDARRAILAYINDRSDAIESQTELFDGVMKPGTRTPAIMGRKDVTHLAEVRRVLEAPEVFDFFRMYFGERVRTLDYKWLRAVGHTTYTGAHMDNVYMGRGSARLHTVWTPFGDIPIEQGTLAICVGSHRDEKYARMRETYGKMDVDRDHVAGWFSQDPLEVSEKYGGQWRTTEVVAGDVIILGMFTLHASTTNTTHRWRVSCDTRFQPASEPADDRWVGDSPKAHNPVGSDTTPIEVARAKWGL